MVPHSRHYLSFAECEALARLRARGMGLARLPIVRDVANTNDFGLSATVINSITDAPTRAMPSGGDTHSPQLAGDS